MSMSFNFQLPAALVPTGESVCPLWSFAARHWLLLSSYWSPWWLLLPIAGCPSTPAVPSLFGTRDRFCGRQFFHGPRLGGWFQDDSSALLLLCALFLLWSHQLHLRSAGVGPGGGGPWSAADLLCSVATLMHHLRQVFWITCCSFYISIRCFTLCFYAMEVASFLKPHKWPLLASEVSSATSSPLSAFTELKRVRPCCGLDSGFKGILWLVWPSV